MTLSELAERCEQATGPDRELDCAISLALVEPPEGCKAVASQLSSQAGLIVDRVGRLHGTVDYQPFTASLDAAMTLVPEGMVWSVDAYADHAEALVRHLFTEGKEVRARTPALALCAAVLKARAASCDTHPKDGDVKQAPLVSGAVTNEVRQTPIPDHSSETPVE